MDKIIKLQSRQGGSWTADSQSSNLIDWDIPNDGVYDLSRSNINLSVNIADPTIGGNEGWADNKGYDNYKKKLADNVANNPVVVPNIVWSAQQSIPIYNATLIKNCSISSEQVGMMEDIRRSDILRQNLFDYTLNEDQKKSMEYSSLRQLQDVDDNVRSIFAELNSGGADNEPLCSNVSQRLKNVDVQIKLNQILELGNVSKYPANKMGKTRVHVELNMDKLKVRYLPQNPNSLLFTDGLNSLNEEIDSIELADEGVVLIAHGIEDDANTTSVQTGVIDHKLPYYVGQLVRVNQPVDIDKPVSGSERFQTNYTLTADATQNATLVNRDFDGCSAGQVVFTLSAAIANDSVVVAVVEGLSGGNMVSEGFTFNKDNGNTTKSTITVFEYINSIKYFVTGGAPQDSQPADITVNANQTDKGINRSFGTIASISKSSSTKRYTITFAGAEGIGNIAAGKKATVGADGLNFAYIDLRGTYPKTAGVVENNVVTTVPSEVTTNFSVETAEIVLRRLASPGKVPNKLEYMTFTTEQFTGAPQRYFQRMFQLEPESVNFMVMFPDSDLFSAPTKSNTVGDPRTDANIGIDSFRLRLDNQDLINRQCKPYSPLYYDRLNMTFVNMGKRLNNTNEWALRNLVSRDQDPTLDIIDIKPFILDGVPVVDPTTYTSYGLNDPVLQGRKPLLMLSNPVPAGKMEKQLQINIDCRSGTTVGEMVLYKQVVRSVGA